MRNYEISSDNIGVGGHGEHVGFAPLEGSID